MLRVALRPRYLGLLALMILATVVCGLLATWQWDRAHRALASETATEAPAVPLGDLMQVGDPVTNAASGRSVTVSGTFDPSQQVLVPGRSVGGTDAVVVVTALHVTAPDGRDTLLPVARGWLPSADVLGADGTPDPSVVPAPPTAAVTVTGRLEASESATQSIEDGVASEIATPMLVNAWGGPMYSGYIAETSPMPGLRAMPQAESAFSRGLDWQNLGYSLQWVLFGGFFLYLWWRAVRTQQLDERAHLAELVEERLRDDDGGARSAAGDHPEHLGDDGAPDHGLHADAAAKVDTGAAGRVGPDAEQAPEGVGPTMRVQPDDGAAPSPARPPLDGGPKASTDAKEDSHGADHPSAR